MSMIDEQLDDSNNDSEKNLSILYDCFFAVFDKCHQKATVYFSIEDEASMNATIQIVGRRQKKNE